MALTDGLTGLYNRREIQRRIISGIEEDRDDDIFLIMLDLDHFKQVNDTYGHKTGDEVLKGTAGVLKNEYGLLKEGDVSGRWGGEEFMIMVRSSDESEILELAEKIREAIASLEFEGPGQVTASLGVTKIQPGENADTAVIRVDKALYEGKEQGRNRVVLM